MTCDHVREQLLELPVDRFDTLAEHLERCPTCAALADRIRQQENEMNAYIDDYAHAPFQPVAAEPTPLVRLRWPVVGTALAMAAAAALWIAAGGPPPTAGPSERGVATAPADDIETIRFGIGRSVILQLGGTPKAVSVVDPDVAAVQTMSSNTLQVLGLAAGRSQLVHTAEDGTREVWWLEVSADSKAPTTSESDQVLRPPTTQLTVKLGERRFVDLKGIPRAVAVTNPDLVKAQMGGSATELAIDGLAVGTTDTLVQYGDGWQVWVITVEP